MIIAHPDRSRTRADRELPPYCGAPRTLCDGLVAEIYLTLDQLDVLAEHTVPRTGSNGVTVWSVDEVWSANEAES
jgi:hypothetical protein